MVKRETVGVVFIWGFELFNCHISVEFMLYVESELALINNGKYVFISHHNVMAYFNFML